MQIPLGNAMDKSYELQRIFCDKDPHKPMTAGMTYKSVSGMQQKEGISSDKAGHEGRSKKPQMKLMAHQQTALDGIATYRIGQGAGGNDGPCVTGKRQAESQDEDEGPSRKRNCEWVRAQARVESFIVEAASRAQEMTAAGQIVTPLKEGR
jgi:hypothetical protein